MSGDANEGKNNGSNITVRVVHEQEGGPVGRGNGTTIIFSPRKIPAAGSVGSAGIRFSSSTSPGAPFLLFPANDIVFLLYDFHELGAGVANRATVQVAKWRDFEYWRICGW